MNRVLTCLSIGGLMAAVTLGADMVSASRVRPLDLASLQEIRGGDCYGPSTMTCGDAPESGCDSDCTRRAGTTSFHCYDGDNLGTNSTYGNYMIQDSHDSHVELSDGEGEDGLSEKKEVLCNEFFCCGCDSEGSCSQDDEEENCVSEGGGDYGDPTKAKVQTPDGDPCQVGGA